MEHQNVTVLRAVDAFQVNFTVKVRVIRIWDHPDKRNPKDIYSMDMILIDEEGTKMEAVCLKRFLAQFQASLVEKQCLIVTNPTIGFNNSTYKYVQNQNIICFQSTTQVTECQDFGGSPYGFDFANFGDILNHVINESVTVDIIGYLTRSFPKEVIRNKSTGKESLKVNIEISDLENRKVYLTLWDQYCDEIIAFLESIKGKKVHAIIILQFGKIKWWNGSPYVNNSYTVSRLFYNHDFDEVNAFKTSLLANDVEVSESSSLGFMTKSAEEEFLESKDFYNISDVFAISEVSKVIVLGTIMGIYKDEGWFYDGCNRCNKKINKEPVFIVEAKEKGSGAKKEVLTCVSDRCINKEITASPKFKIHIRVQDPSVSITLTLFDREARKLVGKSVVDILDANPEFRSDPLKTPAELDVLVDQKIAFKIEVTKYVLRYNIQKYGITKLTVDPNVISVLEQKQCFPQITGSENCSMNLGISDFQSQSADEVKDCLATGFVNTTPVSNMDNTVSLVVLADVDTPATIANKDDVKRNLVEVYDVEEHCSMSATKVHKSSEMEHVNSDEKKKLLIPKLEK